MSILSVRKESKKGFTLIELLVVIAIIGILASIVLASLNTARRKSRDARRVADIKQIQLALELYFDAAGEYPDLIGDLAPTYMPSVPTDPVTSTSYPYDNYPDVNRAACLVASGDCLFYHAGTLIEEVTNGALKGDRDIATAPAAGPGPDGLSTVTACGSDAAATTVTDRCYDVTP